MTRLLWRIALSACASLLAAASAAGQSAAPSGPDGPPGSAGADLGSLRSAAGAQTAQPAPSDVWRVRVFPRPGLRWGDRFRVDLKVLLNLDG